MACLQIARLRVVIDGIVRENLQHLPRAGLAGAPGVGEAAVPADGRQ